MQSFGLSAVGEVLILAFLALIWCRQQQLEKRLMATFQDVLDAAGAEHDIVLKMLALLGLIHDRLVEALAHPAGPDPVALQDLVDKIKADTAAGEAAIAAVSDPAPTDPVADAPAADAPAV